MKMVRSEFALNFVLLRVFCLLTESVMVLTSFFLLLRCFTLDVSKDFWGKYYFTFQEFQVFK